jgi:hypothetical protein
VNNPSNGQTLRKIGHKSVSSITKKTFSRLSNRRIEKIPGIHLFEINNKFSRVFLKQTYTPEKPLIDIFNKHLTLKVYSQRRFLAG